MDVTAIFADLDDHGFADTTNSRKLAVVQDVIHDICSREPWPFLEASAAVNIVGDTVQLPADFKAALAFIVNNCVVTPERLDTVTKSYLTTGSSSAGAPVLYYFIGEAMKVWPSANAAYSGTLMYLRVHPELTEGSVSADILIPPRHHRVIVLGALSKLYAMEDDTELSALFITQFEQRLVSMEQDLWKKQYDRPDRVVDLGFFDGDDC